MEMEIGLGTRVGILRGDTIVFGGIDGIKLNRGEIERVSVESMDYWFWMSDGWQFISDEAEETNGEV